ncbi:uncharacterized protein LOC143357737 [Halictus rubicundus]|uniref:uncharacterized protein LOC143357737 n=1 Tax=Halictus rubicundus TaxID=77578 RepID=UPI004036E067
MSVGKRLHLDEVVSSFPELGPTVPDGGYSWVVLCGVCLVQMTIPSILPMYGVVLDFINESRSIELSLWSEKIMLTPILFIAFWNLADPWTRMIVSMASIPRLVGIIGVTLLTVGILATGYLATGGVGAYLASSSAGAVMGIGASFVVLLSDYVLRKNFRKKLLLALTLKNVATSIGLIIIPSITDLLLHNTGLKSGLQLMTMILIPTALGALTFHLPSAQSTSPYSLLLSEEDNEIPIRTSSDAPENTLELNSPSRPGSHNYGDADERAHNDELFSEGNNMYSYQEPDDDVDLFVSPLQPSDSKWKQQLQLLKNLRFWMAVVGWVGMKLCTLFFWLWLPVISSMTPAERSVRVLQFTMAGFGTLLPNIASYKILQLTNHNRRIYFGLASWFCAVILIGLTYARGSMIVMIWALLGGISIGSLSSCQDLALYDVMGIETMRSVNKGFSTIVGLCVLVFSFVHSVNFCMNITSALLFFGGLFWLSSPILSFMESTRYRQSCAANA